MLVNNDYATDKSLAEGVVGQMEKLGLRVVLNALDGTQRDAAQYAGRFDWLIRRNDAGTDLGGAEHRAACSRRPADQLASPRAGKRRQLDLMPFEKELVDIVNKFIASQDNDERAEPDEAVPEDLDRDTSTTSA